MHVDEITVWSWVAASVFAMIALVAVIVATQDKMMLPYAPGAPVPPFAQPAFGPPALATDGRA
jgi:hypothetical protein